MSRLFTHSHTKNEMWRSRPKPLRTEGMKAKTDPSTPIQPLDDGKGPSIMSWLIAGLVLAVMAGLAWGLSS